MLENEYCEQGGIPQDLFETSNFENLVGGFMESCGYCEEEAKRQAGLVMVNQFNY